MGVVFGKTKIFEPEYEVLRSGDYEVRLMKPGIAAEIPIGEDEEAASQILTAYVGISGLPNSQQVDKRIIGPYSHVAVTPPALTPDSVLQFFLPNQYKEITDAPPPTHPNITIRKLPERVVAVYRFSGTADAERSLRKLRKLKTLLQQDGLLPPSAPGDEACSHLEHTLTWDVVEYHPKVTLPAFRRNEVWIELPTQGNPTVLRLLQGRAVPPTAAEPVPEPEPHLAEGEVKEPELSVRQELPFSNKGKVSFDIAGEKEAEEEEPSAAIVIKEPMLPMAAEEEGSAAPAIVNQED